MIETGFWFLALQTLYLIIPGIIANMLPPLMKWVNFLNYPVDFGRKWKGKPLFGKNKTFRGFFFGIIGAIAAFFAQTELYMVSDFFRRLSLLPYDQHSFLLLGLLVGFGVLFGDAIESFFKRQVGKKPGEKWVPWDQVDCLIGGLAFMLFVYIPPWEVVVIAVVGVPVLHISLNHLSYYLGLQKNKW